MKLEADLGWDKWYKLEVAKPVRKRLYRAIARGRRTTSGMPTAVTDCRLFGQALCRPESKSCRTRGREILTVYSIIRRITWKLTPLGLAFALGCQGDKLASPEGSATLVASVSGAMVPEHEMRASMTAAARLVALSLRSDRLREAVLASLQTSPYREHKLHLSEFLRGQGRQILAGMAVAAGSGVTQDSVLARLNGVMDLEFYMPVRSHFAAWGGGSEVVVATALRDHEIPVGFRVDGSPFRFESAEEPPNVPVLALVPVETDFRLRPAFQQCWEDCGDGQGGSGGGSPPPPPPSAPGLYMTFVSQLGDYEGFLMGDPEFEIHIMARKSALDTGAVDNQCIGNDAASSSNQPGYKSSLYAYDQNDAEWSGSVMLFDQARIDAVQQIDSSFAIWMWEDDNDPCKIVSTDFDYVSAAWNLAQILFGGWNARKVVSHPTLALALAAATTLKKAWNTFSNWQNDDQVGHFVPAAAVGASYTDATDAIVHKDGSVRGRVKLVLVQ